MIDAPAGSQTDLNAPIRVGVFDSLPAAEEAVRKLLDAGFSHDQITVVCSDEARQQHFRQFAHEAPSGDHTQTAEVAGGVIGAVLGGLAVLTGVVASGGLGLLTTGVIIAANAGMTGTFVGAMMTRGVERELADFYDQEVVRGGILVAVSADGPERKELLALASKVFEQCGSQPVPLNRG